MRQAVFPLSVASAALASVVYCNRQPIAGTCMDLYLSGLIQADQDTTVRPSLFKLRCYNQISKCGLTLLRTLDRYPELSSSYANHDAFAFYCDKLNFSYLIRIYKIQPNFLCISRNRPRNFQSRDSSAMIKTTHGACRAMAIEVAKLYLNGTHIADALKAFKSGYSIRYEFLNDDYNKRLVKRNMRSGEIMIDDEYLKSETGLKITFKSRTLYSLKDKGKLMAEFQQCLRPGIYLCSSLDFIGHAVLVIVNDDSLVLYDPNVGAFSFSYDDVKKNFYEVLAILLNFENVNGMIMMKLEKC